MLKDKEDPVEARGSSTRKENVIKSFKTSNSDLDWIHTLFRKLRPCTVFDDGQESVSLSNMYYGKPYPSEWLFEQHETLLEV